MNKASRTAAETTFNNLNDYVSVMDRKVAILFSGQVAFLGLFLNAMLPGGHLDTLVPIILTLATTTLGLIAFGCSFIAVLPR